MLDYNKDSTTGGIVNVEEYDHYVHIGEAYYAAIDRQIPGGQTVYTAFKTPLNKKVHMKDRILEAVYVSGATKEVNVTINVYEAGTYSDGTSVNVTNHNSNRQSSNTSNVQVHKVGVTVTPGNQGLNLNRRTRVKAASDSSVAGGTAKEYIMKPDTVYIAEIINGSNSVVEVSLKWFWYETLFNINN